MMIIVANVRPTPEELLSRIEAEEQRARKGQLKLFLGACAGVGKTYAMLSEGHQLLERGVDVVVAVAVTHGRKDTEALLQDLPSVPERSIEYRGVVLKELDIDRVLLRRPAIVIIDELPHTNAPGSRHAKRWQDVQEILDAGIGVYSALNVQHVESLTDVVAQISGVQVKETVPDAILNRADDIELVDITPDELRLRVREGKVYVHEQIDKALEGFFKTGTLIALRELALRKVADRVDAQMEHYRADSGVSSLWAVRERVLVCIAPNHLAEKVVRSAARIGSASHAELTALYVESSRQGDRSSKQRKEAEDALKRAEELGMDVARRSSHDIVGEILNFASSRHISLIVVGKPIKSRWKTLVQASVVDELLRRSGDIAIYLLSGQAEDGDVARPGRSIPSVNIKDALTAFLLVGASTGLSFLSYAYLPQLPRENIVMIYLLGIALCSSRASIGAALACSVLSVLAYDFFFIPPRFQLAVSDVAYIPTFAVMLGVGFVISSLTTRLKNEFLRASERERRSAALYDATKEMAKARGKENIAIAASRRMSQDLKVDLAVLLPSDTGRLTVVSRSHSHFENDHREVPVAQWVLDRGIPAGSGTDTLPSAKALYLPLRTGDKTVGVLGAKALVEGENIDPHQLEVLDSFTSGLAVAVERASLVKESAEARLEAESEKLRNSLLSSVSHDIRSPLTAIAGAASALVEGNGDPKKLAETIYSESQRLNRHVRNLLDMTRIESGSVQANLDWNSLEEMLGVALGRVEHQLADREVQVHAPPDLPLIRCDGLLVEQAIINLLENAVKHTPPHTSIEVRAELANRHVNVYIIDHGAGIPAGDRERVFDKFYRQASNEGFGLGLAISKAIARMNNGDLTAAETPGGGATFVLSLPVSDTLPEVPVG